MCYRHGAPGIVRATKPARLLNRPHTYVIVASPPFWGSTATLGFLATSPATTTMCAAITGLGYHQGGGCESHWLLWDRRIMIVSGNGTDHPTLTTNWAAAYEVFTGNSSRGHGIMWGDATKPLRLDKSPPEIRQSKSL